MGTRRDECPSLSLSLSRRGHSSQHGMGTRTHIRTGCTGPERADRGEEGGRGGRARGGGWGRRRGGSTGRRRHRRAWARVAVGGGGAAAESAHGPRRRRKAALRAPFARPRTPRARQLRRQGGPERCMWPRRRVSARAGRRPTAGRRRRRRPPACRGAKAAAPRALIRGPDHYFPRALIRGPDHYFPRALIRGPDHYFHLVGEPANARCI